MEDKQVDINWETVGRFGFVPSSLKVWTREFEKLRQSLLGMEMAMKSASPSQIGGPLHKLVSGPLLYLTDWSSLALRHAAGLGGIRSPAILDRGKRALLSFDEAVSVSINKTESYHEDAEYSPKNPIDVKSYFQSHLPGFFFLFASKMFFKDLMDLLSQNERPASAKTDGHQKSTDTTAVPFIQAQQQQLECRALSWQLRLSSLMAGKLVDRHRLIVALKCSSALGLSVLFGLLFSSERGHWAGIAVATSMGSSRESTFRLANVRAQGTVAGSVYGIIACILTQQFMLLRAAALLPWVVFTSFLRQSKMYGYAGGVSAFTAALVILGRKNADPPSQFAIIRITETFIGMACYSIVELALQPRRAANLAREELILSLRMLQISMNSLVLYAPENSSYTFANLADLRRNQSKLRDRVSRLKAFIEEANAEPDLWFHPFSGNTYSKLLENLTNMADYIHFAGRALETVAQLPNNFPQQIPTEMIQEAIARNLHTFGVHAVSVLQCVVGVLEIKSLGKLIGNHCRNQSLSDHSQLSGKLYKGFGTTDPEGAEADTISNLKHQNLNDAQMNAVICSLAQTLEQGITGAHHYKGEWLLSFGALAFTVVGMAKEIRALQMSVQGLLQWENPWSLINIHHIHRLNLSREDVQHHSQFQPIRTNK